MVLDEHDLLVIAMQDAVMVAVAFLDDDLGVMAVMVPLAFLDDDLAFVGACRRGQRHGNADGRQGGNRDSNLTHGGLLHYPAHRWPLKTPREGNRFRSSRIFI